MSDDNAPKCEFCGRAASRCARIGNPAHTSPSTTPTTNRRLNLGFFAHRGNS